MRHLRLIIAIIAGAAFMAGSGYIIYTGRPAAIMDAQQRQQAQQQDQTATAPAASAIIPAPASLPPVGDDGGEREDGEEGGVTTPAPAPTPTPAPTPAPAPSPAPAPTPAPTTNAHVFTMAQVRAHASVSDCWSAIDGGVYDLTSWIDRHPGGPDVIIGLCGTDGSAAYDNQHGGASRPAYFLALLKIGTLQ